MPAPSPETFRRLLCALQIHIRDRLIAARARQAQRFARVAAVTAADTIYHIDRVSEEAIVEWFESHWPARAPVEVVMEGIEDSALTFPRGTPVGHTRFKCILDPIDGTRGLMYDKRSAWALAGLAPQRGARTHLGDIFVAAMTELPVSKQWRAEQFSAVRGRGVVATYDDLRGGVRDRRQRVQPSRARDFKHGFAVFSRFFTTGKALIGALEEAVWAELHGHAPERSPLVFDDQYISTGGQLAEMLVGHDRMIVDVRPLVFAKLCQPSALVCHPYDICTALILREAGALIETPAGGPLRAPLDTTSPVSWCGFANPSLARLARPALRRALKQLL
jgi:fructose-1,6-bisphosphatase/inositol monophosphatase family enzyme